jgi:hypothetical protein
METQRMLFEFSGVCHHCGLAQSVLIHNGQLMTDCPECSEEPFNLRKLAGVVYIVSNSNQRGVKIGRTVKTVEERIRQLSSTGVPGKFVPIAIFPSDKPREMEKRVHAKLAKNKIEKEHFDVKPVDAVLGAYRALNRRVEPIFFDERVEETFRLRLEEARIQMQLRLKSKK